jgi:ankyrin repeat protein
MITNNILELEYAIKENNIKKIKKILKENPEEINKIEIHRFIDMIHFNEFDLFDNILKSINSKLKKKLLSNNIIIIKLLKSNNINFINKYIKYINLDLSYDDNDNIIKICTETTNLELVKIIYKIYKSSKKYLLLNFILVFYKNNNIKVNLELIKFLIKIDKNIINTNNDDNNIPIIANASLNNNLELLNILKEAGINFYYEKFNILIYYFYRVNKIDNDIILYLLNNNININICDKELWLMAHVVFFNPDYFTLEVKKIILEKTNNINIQNTLGNTPLHYLVYNNNIDDYKDILIKKELNIFIKNKGLYSPLSLAEIKKQNLIDLAVKSFIYHIKKKSIKFSPEEAKEYILKNKTTIYNKFNYDDNYDDIIIGDYNYIKHSKFIANDINIHLFIIILLQKYNILGVPYLPNSQNCSNYKSLIENKKFDNLTFNNQKKYFLKYLYYSEELMYFRIYWADENNYIISPKIGEAIQNIFKFKKYVFIDIHILNQFISHGNVLIFDRDKKLIVHFEPHGKIISYVGKLYETLKNFFKKELKDFKYITPIEYLPSDAYQSMYDGESLYITKVGDQGYCCAWCFWFIELYINNTKYDLKSLVNKSIKKLINTKYTFIDHIRNYANYLNNKIEELLLEYNIPNKFINNLLLEDKYIDEILNNISFNLKQLNY